MQQDLEGDQGGYDVDDWDRLQPFTGRVAEQADVARRAAVFALGDTHRPRPLDMDLPQPAIWWSDDGEQAAVVVQAESHETEEGETMDVLGLILPDGEAAIALLEDVDLVDASDPVWRELVEGAVEEEES
jgi:hypothetical protein